MAYHWTWNVTARERLKPVRRLSGLVLGLTLLTGSGCETDLGSAKFCHNLTIDGQPAVLQLVQGERKLTANTNECSPCTPIKIGDTFELQVRGPADSVLLSNFYYLQPNTRTYLFSASRDPDETVQLNVRGFGTAVSCAVIPIQADAGASSLLPRE